MVSASGVQMGKTWAALHMSLDGVSVALEGFGWFLSTRLLKVPCEYTSLTMLRPSFRGQTDRKMIWKFP